MARVWIIDDDESFLHMVGDALGEAGHSVTLFLRGEDVLARLREAGIAVPDLFLLDVMMPDLDGYALHQALHQDPATRSVPIIIMTAKDWARPVFTHSLNVVAFLPKPFDISLLREAVSVALRGSQ